MALTLRHAVRPLITLAAVGASTALVACGGSEASGDDEQASFEDAQVEFAECMRENGIDLPDPETSEGGEGGGGFRIEAGEADFDPNSDEFQAAQEKCEPLIEDAVPEGERPDPAEIRDQLHQMTECLRDKGYDVPEPQIEILGEEDGDGPQTQRIGPPAGSADEMEELRDDPEFRQAQEDCSEEAGLPEGGPGGGPPGGPDGDGG
jgi:hypothetical protein